MDTLFMNGNKKAQDILDDQFDMIVSDDCNMFNAGSFFIKNSEWSKQYLREVLNVTAPVPEWAQEQSALMNVKDEKSYHEHFKWVDQRDINSYPNNICPSEKPSNEYQHGDLLLHFANHSWRGDWLEILFKYYYKTTGLENIFIP